MCSVDDADGNKFMWCTSAERAGAASNPAGASGALQQSNRGPKTCTCKLQVAEFSSGDCRLGLKPQQVQQHKLKFSMTGLFRTFLHHLVPLESPDAGNNKSILLAKLANKTEVPASDVATSTSILVANPASHKQEPSRLNKSLSDLKTRRKEFQQCESYKDTCLTKGSYQICISD